THPGFTESRRPVSDARPVAGARVVGPSGREQAPASREATGKGNGSRGQWGQGVGGLHRSVDVGERDGSRTRPSTGGPCWWELQEGIMPSALTFENMSPGLLKGVERAKREPEGRFHALAHLLDVPALTRAYRRARSDAAVGVDGVTKEQYGQDLEINFQALHARLKAKQYRHQPLRPVHIP